MDKFLGNLICIDWGFTHLKLIALDKNKNYLEKKIVSTDKISKDNKFYFDLDLIKIKNIIYDFIFKYSNSEGLKIYSCSQMHGIAGYLKSGESFFSTWNDEPTKKYNDEKIKIDSGIPVLISMPVNKLFIDKNKVFLKTKTTDNFFKNQLLEVKKISSPLCLIFYEIFKQKISCARSWWQSSTIENKQTINSKRMMRISEKPLIIKDKVLEEKFIKKIIIFPEQGDLQTSVFKSIYDADVILNLGTGSQIIFCWKRRSDVFNYFRIFPQNRKFPVISHIPCGKIFHKFALANDISIQQLMDKGYLSKISNENNKDENLTSLLFFPGFCSEENIYKNINLNLEDAFRKISFEDIIDLWIDQYVDIINFYFLNVNKETIINLHIIGSLGGIVESNFSKFKKKFGSKYKLTHKKFSLIESFEKMYKY